MIKALKIVGITAGALVGLLVVALVVLKIISDDQYKEWITSGVQSATGRDFSIESLDLDFNTSLKVNANGVRMANVGWGSTPEMLTVGELEAEVSLISLLGGVADFRTVVKHAAVVVENNAEGTSNWSMDAGAPADDEDRDDADTDRDEDGLPIRPLIREFRIEDFTLTLKESPEAQEKTAHIEKLLIETPQIDTTLSLAATFQELPINFKGNLGPVSEVVDRLSSPLKLDGSVGDDTIGISGNWGPLMPDPNMDLKLKVDIPSTANTLSAIGYHLQELGVAAINVDLAAKDGRFSIARVLTNLDGEASAASIEGSISDLLALEGIDITVQAQTSGLTQLLKKLKVPGIPFELPSDVEISTNIHGSLTGLGFRDFVAKITDEGVEVNVTGTIDDALSPEGLDATFTANVASTAALSKYAGRDIPNLGALSATGKITSANKVVSLSDLAAGLVSDNININVTGGVSDLISVSGIKASLDAEISSLTAQNISGIDALLKQFGIQVPMELLPKSAMLVAQASGDLERLDVNNINAEIRDDGIHVTLAGAVANAMGPEGIDATFGIASESTSALSKYAGMELPELGKVDVSGKLRSENKTYILEALDGNLDGGNIVLNVSGGVGDLVGISGIDGRMDLDISSLTERNLSDITKLLERFKVELPLDLLPAAARLHASAAGDLDLLEIKDVDAEVRDAGVVVTLKGGIENAINREGINADITFNSENLAALSKYVRRDLPNSGPLHIAARVTSKGKVITLNNLDAKLEGDEFNLALNAGVDEFRVDELMTDGGIDMQAISGIKAELNSTINSLDIFSELAQTELPPTDPITVTANVSDDSEGSKRAARATVNVQTGTAKLAVEGLLADLTTADRLDVSILVEADSLSDFDKLARSELPDKGPLKLSGTAKARPNEYTLDDFQLTLDDQSANGFIGIKMTESEADNHSLKGELNIPYLDLSPLLGSAPVEEASAGQPEITPANEAATKDVREEGEIAAAEKDLTDSSDKLFSTDPLPLALLRKINADFSVTAQRLVLGKTEMSDFKAVLSLEDGLLNIDPIKSLAGNGTIDARIGLDGRSDVARLGVDILLDKIPMPRLGGGLDSKVKLDGDGASPADLMGGLDGRILIVVRDGTIPHSFATNFGSGLLSFTGGKDNTRLECGILRMDIKDGIVDFDDKLAVQLSDVTWLGGGDINLKTEKLDVGIAPKPRKGVGISAGSLASLVHFGGTLKHPSMQLDPKDVAVKYGKYMAAMSTGGLSLLAGALFDKMQANQDVCEAILSGTVFDEDAENTIDESGGKEAEKQKKKPVPKNLQ